MTSGGWPTSSSLTRLRATAYKGERQPAPEGKREAGVLLLFDPSQPNLPLLFTLRNQSLRKHPGQISFPGGSSEPGDADINATALREAEEEVGLPPDNVEVFGSLRPHLTAVSDLWLTPVLGLQLRPWTVKPDPVEVAEWFRIGLDELIRAEHTTQIWNKSSTSATVHFYSAAGRTIWGVTGAILNDLLSLMDPARS